MTRGIRIKVAPKEERTCDNIVFDSKREMVEYQNFKILERSGAIAKLELQVPFPLWAAPASPDVEGRKPIAKYVADFVVTEKDGTVRVYDAKGHRTEMYKLKQKWFEASYPHLRIVEL